MEDTTAYAPVRFTTTCRGKGKIFWRLACDFETIERWEAEAATEFGDAVPARVIEHETFGPVLELAIIMCTQTVSVRAYGEGDILLAAATKVVRPKQMKAASIVNTALKADEVELLREILQHDIEEGAIFHSERLIHIWHEDAGPERILHIALTLRSGAGASCEGPVHLKAIAVDGTVIPAAKVKVLSDVTKRFPEVVSSEERTLVVSLRIRPDQGSICLWAQFEDDRQDTFFVVTPNEMRDLSIEGDSTEIPVEGVSNYERWMLSERSDESALAAQREMQKDFAIRPVFSIVIPLWHTPIDFLREAVDCMLEQSYPNIELILVNSTPEDEEMSAVADDYARRDGRVKIVDLEGNFGITENTNAGIAVATGDFISFMDHDDLAERDLFYWYVKGINDYPETDRIYCDEDLFIEGHYKNGFLKPDWSCVFEESNNYACHLLTVRRSIVEDLPRPTSLFDGAQDHNMTLAVSERARNVYHVRKVLYHWRSHPLSTAQNPEAKPESLTAGKIAIERHLQRMGIDATVTPRKDWLHVYDVRLKLSDRPRVKVVAWGEGTFDDRIAKQFEEVADVEVVQAGREGQGPWSAAVRRATTDVSSDVVVIASRDARVSYASHVSQLLAYALRPDIGVVGPRLLYADGIIASLGVACSGRGGLFHWGRFLPMETGYGRGTAQLPHAVTAISPALMAIDAKALEAAGGWDETLTMECAAVDASLRLAAAKLSTCVIGTVEYIVPLEAIRSENRQSTREAEERLSWSRLMAKWPKLAGDDRFYHGSLSLDGKFGFEGSWRWLIPMGAMENLRFKVTY